MWVAICFGTGTEYASPVMIIVTGGAGYPVVESLKDLYNQIKPNGNASESRQQPY